MRPVLVAVNCPCLQGMGVEQAVPCHVPCPMCSVLVKVNPPPVAGLCCSPAPCRQRHACRPTWQRFVPDLLLWRQRPAGSKPGTLQMWCWTWGPSVSDATAAFWRPGKCTLASRKLTLLRRTAPATTGQSALCCQGSPGETSQQVMQHPSPCVEQACSHQQHVIKAGGPPVYVVFEGV